MGSLTLFPHAVTSAIVITPTQVAHYPANKKLVNVQGKLTDSSGNPLTGSNIVVTFRLYNNLNDPISSAVWTESQSVTPLNGLFNVSIGKVAALDPIPFNTSYYLGMQVAGDNDEMTPRQLLGASAYALGSLGDFNVQGNAVVSSSATVNGSLAVNSDISTNGNLSANGNVSVAGSMSLGGKDVGNYLVPAGAIMMFAAACPAGWTRFTALDNVFPLGSAAYGTAGGSSSNTHNHNISSDGSHYHNTPNHQHDLAYSMTPYFLQGSFVPSIYSPDSSGAALGTIGLSKYQTGNLRVISNRTQNSGAGVTDTQGAHNHGGTTANSTISILPPYVTVVWCQKQ